MYLHSFKEEFGSVLCCDPLLSSHQYIHLRKYIHDHKYIVIFMLGRREARQLIHGDKLPRLVVSMQRSVQALLIDSWLCDGIGSA